MSRPSPMPLLQYDILDQVLSYCVPPPCTYEALRLDAADYFSPIVPKESVWLAGAARTCQAWLEPALRHLCLVIHLNIAVKCPSSNVFHALPLDVLQRIGHRVRSLVLTVEMNKRVPRVPSKPSANPFKHFTKLATLIILERPDHDYSNCCPNLLPHIRLCPSLSKLTNLFIWSSEREILLELFGTCKSLRRLGFNIRSRSGHCSDSYYNFVVPESLEELTIFFSGSRGNRRPAPLSLSYWQSDNPADVKNTHNYSLFHQAINASAGSLQALSLFDLPSECEQEINDEIPNRIRLQARLLVQPVALCKSLRFLRLSGYIVFGITPVRDVFELLAPLPIEFLSLGWKSALSFLPESNTVESIPDRLAECLPLLPNLLVIMLDLPMDRIRRVQSTVGRLAVVERQRPDDNAWPPFYDTLSPEAQAAFKHRPYPLPPGSSNPDI
jgi:hypothetical protein